ncbi:MAG: D-alanyl-D-alanine carboxypeptidase/D-alanyl-D-alanine endopeptidase [Gaiellaceae bacterium]
MTRAGRPIFVRRRTHRWRWAFPAAVAAVLAAAGPAGAVRRSDSDLGARLARALRVPSISTGSSAAIAVDLTTGERVFALNGSLPLEPASNEKLAVTYAALTKLGPSFRIETHVEEAGTQDGTTLTGSLYLIGAGDPSLSHAGLVALARGVRAAGILRVTGGVVGDESAFDTKRAGPGWKPKFYLDESPPLSALVVDRAQYRGRTSKWPAQAAAILFRDALRAAGVSVPKHVTVGPAPATALDVTSIKSAPLSRIVSFMDQESDNFTAEMLLKLLSLIDVPRGSTFAGARLVSRTLAEAGVPMKGVRIVDGSGLSLLDRLTADALVSILQTMHNDPLLSPVLARALPAAGMSGTLKDRMRDAQLRGRVHAKTGTTDEASALSGFAGRYVFAILQNGNPVSDFWARVAQDRFARLLVTR